LRIIIQILFFYSVFELPPALAGGQNKSSYMALAKIPSSAKAKNFCLNFIPPAKAGGNSDILYL